MEQHTHCQICSKPIPLEERFCSEKCREKYESLMKKRKRRVYIMYGLLIVFIVVLILSTYGFW